MSFENVQIVVAGGLGTDIFALGLNRIIGPGELEFGGKLHLGAGGKSRNIAQMTACLLGNNRVAMVGRTSKDPMNLWSVPVDALKNAGVNVEFTKVIPYEESGKFPQIALIAVDKKGNNQIYVIPGINEDFCAEDVTDALPLFQAAAKNHGLFVLSLELPLPTAVHAIKQANAAGLKVVFDPGGIRPSENHQELLAQEIFLVKPNEHEAEILTGIKVDDLKSAQVAAEKFMSRGARNVLITLGARGAYLVTADGSTHIPIPSLPDSPHKDETGCGDQTMATLCAALLSGANLATAARQAVLAGTLQFQRAGIIPVTMSELDEYSPAAAP